MARRAPILGFAGGAVTGAVMALVGCAEPIPEHPIYTDVLPVFHAHCIRCHGAGGTLNDDPPTAQVLGAPVQTYLGHYADDYSGCPMPGIFTLPATETCRIGAKTAAGPLQVLIHSSGLGRMPPPPSDGLNDWELRLLDRWVDNNAPEK